MSQSYFRRFPQFFFLRLSMNKWLDSKHLRPMFVRLAGIKIGKPCHIGANVTFDNWDARLFEIGHHVTITMNSVLLTHGMKEQSDGSYKSKVGKLKIGNHVFIGAGTVITQPLTIGNNVIIGAGSVVTRSIPDNCIVGGVPARVLKERKPRDPETGMLI